MVLSWKLLNHPQLSDIISDEDEAIFQSLHYIEVEEDDDVKSGFKIHFVRCGQCCDGGIGVHSSIVVVVGGRREEGRG